MFLQLKHSSDKLLNMQLQFYITRQFNSDVQWPSNITTVLTGKHCHYIQQHLTTSIGTKSNLAACVKVCKVIEYNWPTTLLFCYIVEVALPTFQQTVLVKQVLQRALKVSLRQRVTITISHYQNTSTATQ